MSAACRLQRLGVPNLLVLEREREFGGIPRHTTHPGFGFSQFGWPYTGPAYVRRLLRGCRHVELRQSSTVTRLQPGGVIEVASEQGLESLQGKAVLITTGIRENSGAARLVSSDRPWGCYTTGAIQQFIHLAGHNPCLRPVIIGSEWVSFSAVLTLKRSGIDPVALVEENQSVSASPWADRFTALMQRVPVYKQARLDRILGKESVEGVEITYKGKHVVLNCDSVIFTGQFVPEASLVMNSHLEFDTRTRGPVIDQYWRCSDPAYYAAGNVLRSVESSGVSAREGQAAAHSIADALRTEVRESRRVRVEVSPALSYIYPQVVATPGDNMHNLQFRTRSDCPVAGEISIVRNGQEIWRKKISARAQQRIRLPARKVAVDGLDSLRIGFDKHNN